jgi:hypothetical protein
VGAQGTATLDFGPFPGASDASLDVTGQAGFVASSLVEAWLRPVATADHTADEHTVETLAIFAFYKVDGTFTIRGVNTSQLNEPVAPDPFTGALIQAGATAVAWRPATSPGKATRGGGRGTRIYGTWSVAWAWN